MKMKKQILMLLLALLVGLPTLSAQSKKEKKEQKKEVVKVVPEQTTTTTVHTAPEAAAVVVKDVKGNVRDVDEYNRRYTSVEVEEPYREDDSVIYEDSDENESSSERRSDTEYTERIIRYHSPSKITIA